MCRWSPSRSAGRGSAVAFIGGTDDYAIALETARTLLKAMGGKGNLVVLEGPDTIPTAAGRLRGFKDALKEFPDVKVVLSKNAMYARPAAADLLKTMLKLNPRRRSTAFSPPTMPWPSARWRRSRKQRRSCR